MTSLRVRPKKPPRRRKTTRRGLPDERDLGRLRRPPPRQTRSARYPCGRPRDRRGCDRASHRRAARPDRRPNQPVDGCPGRDRLRSRPLAEQGPHPLPEDRSGPPDVCCRPAAHPERRAQRNLIGGVLRAALRLASSGHLSARGRPSARAGRRRPAVPARSDRGRSPPPASGAVERLHTDERCPPRAERGARPTSRHRRYRHLADRDGDRG